jgi:hypothetical protein
MLIYKVNEIHKPAFNDTVLVQLPIWIWYKTGGRLLGKQADAPSLDESEVDDDHYDGLGDATSNTLVGESKRRKPKVRARP